MALGLVAAHLLLPSAVAVAAGVGAWRCWRMLRYAADPRLQKLMWFYGLFAASLVSFAIWTGQLAASTGLAAPSGSFAERFGELHAEFSGGQRVNVFLIAHHVMMLASLAIAVQAFSPKRAKGVEIAAIGLAFLGPFILVALTMEALLTLYLVIRAIQNHRERKTQGALQVAGGFLFFFLGHLSFLLFYQPGVARTPIGDVLALVGIVLLVRLLPRPSA